MSAGKAMAQVGHAAQIGWWQLDAEQRRGVGRGRLPARGAHGDARGLAPAGRRRPPLVRDAGFTEIAPGSCTVVADLRVVQ